MNKNKLLKGLLIGLLSTSVVACGPKTPGGGGGGGKTTPEEILPDPVDELDSIPEDVRNYRGDIDFLIYIEGQNGTMEDCGNAKWTADDVCFIEMAKFVAAARAFKKVAPGVKINLIYCSIDEYNNRMIQYREKKGHLPHLMWGVDHVVEMIQNGLYADISKFCGDDKFDEYYNSFNEYIMSRFNFGGFQAAIPIAAEPWGMFVNLNSLKQYGIVDPDDEDAYQEWVDDLTWDNFVDVCARTTDDTHAGLSMVVDYLLSYAAPSVYDSFLKNGEVELDNDLVRDLLEKEQELTNYTVYDFGTTAGKPQFPEARTWWGTQNFCQDQYATFYAEAPWALSTISQYIESHELNTRVDFLPYPKATDSDPANVGIAVEGVGVGNLCPVGENGAVCYSATAELEEKVAAFFALFMSSDVRATESRANINFNYNGSTYVGALGLPIVKRDYRFAWQDDDEKVAALGGDPTADYLDLFNYSMAKYFEVNGLYVTDGNDPDVVNYSNITYGLTKMLDAVYGDDVTCINFWNEPVNIPDGESTKDIFEDWQGRYKKYELGSESYVSNVVAMLSEWEDEINQDIESAWELIQQMIEIFYDGDYNVLDHSSRNNY